MPGRCRIPPCAAVEIMRHNANSAIRVPLVHYVALSGDACQFRIVSTVIVGQDVARNTSSPLAQLPRLLLSAVPARPSSTC